MKWGFCTDGVLKGPRKQVGAQTCSFKASKERPLRVSHTCPSVGSETSPTACKPHGMRGLPSWGVAVYVGGLSNHQGISRGMNMEFEMRSLLVPPGPRDLSLPPHHHPVLSLTYFPLCLASS